MTDPASDPQAVPSPAAAEADSHPLMDTIADWLMGQALAEPELEELVAGCSQRLHAAGFPIARSMVAFSTLHPLYRSFSIVWTPAEGVQSQAHPHTHGMSEAWLASPLYFMIRNRLPQLRRRLAGTDAMLDFPYLKELAEAGMSDYLAYMIPFGETIDPYDIGAGVVGSWTTDRPTGFSQWEIRELTRIQRRLAVALKVRIKDQIAHHVLATYLGPDAGRKVLAGQIRRGDGEHINAVVWYSDMRDSTALADSLDSDTFLQLLNRYFECTAGAVLDHGGQVLRFVGDAVLAIFPIGADRDSREGAIECCGACGKAVAAALQALSGRESIHQGIPGGQPIDFGIALHVGEVLYGNIGVPSRLEFTVIGPTANEVARIADLTKTVGVPVLVSAEFARSLPTGLVSVGTHVARGVQRPLELLTLEQFLPQAVDS